jgi:hypothetical protein
MQLKRILENEESSKIIKLLIPDETLKRES